MSKLACHCGAVISNVEYPSSTEGKIRTQEDYETYECRIEERIASFLVAVAEGTRENWIRTFFNPGYPLEVLDSEVTADIRTRFEIEFLLSMCECRKCGRLFIQKCPGKNEYVCFEPRSGNYEAILTRKGAEPGG